MLVRRKFWCELTKTFINKLVSHFFMSSPQTIEVVKYIGPEDPKIVKDRQKNITDLNKTLGFVFQRPIEVYDILQEDSIETADVRFYLINSHGCVQNERHFIQVEGGIIPTLDMVLTDLEHRDNQRETPTIVMVDACYSGQLIQESPKDLAVFTSDENKEVCYNFSNIFSHLSESLEQLPLIKNEFDTDFIYKVLTESRTEWSELKKLKERFGFLHESEEDLNSLPNTTGYNRTKMSFQLPERSEIELFDDLHELDFLKSGISAQGYNYKPLDLPDNLKERYVKLLRSRRDELTFSHLNPGLTSYKLLKSGAWEFGHPFCERILNTLEETPTDQWIKIWHHYFKKYAAEIDENLIW